VDAAAVYLKNSDNGELEQYSTAGFRTVSIQGRKIVASPAAFSNQPQAPVLDEFASEVSAQPCFAEEQFVSYYRIPLLTRGNPCGILELFSRSAVQWAATWTEYAYTLARHAMIAIDNHQLLARLEKSNLDLTAAYEETLEGWS